MISELSQVDNGITFLDNYDKIVNPTNMKTPPPPMWGTVLEEDNYDASEDFYNHGRAMNELEKKRAEELVKLEANGGRATVSQRSKILKLKRKVLYTYEYSDPSDDENPKAMVKKVEPQLPALKTPKATYDY